MKLFFLYIDPGSGSYIIQLIIAGVLGSAFFFKNSWRRLKEFFTGKKKETEDHPDNDL